MGAQHCPYYSLAWLPLHSHYNGPLWKTAHFLAKALHRGLYFAIIMDRYGGPHIALNIALHGGLYLTIITDGYGRPHTSLIIALHGDI
jgi:hypothetical protein